MGSEFRRREFLTNGVVTVAASTAASLGAGSNTEGGQTGASPVFRNRILERIAKGEKALGLSMSEPSEEMLELAGRMGLDFVGFDGQHSPIEPRRVEALCRLADGYGLTVGMRVPDGRESTLLSYLDRGVKQITVPNLQTREEAEAIVKYSFFAPLGLRSATSIRMVFHQTEGRQELFKTVNVNTVIVPQLESITAVENLDEILKVEGLNYFGGGPEDMAQSLGLSGQHTHPRVRKVYQLVKEKVEAAGKQMWGESAESVHLFHLAKAGIADLMKRNGREPGLRW
jgi:4-hydroxy-2-oxoheptanedioate aldolase